MTSITPILEAQIAKAIEAILEGRRRAPQPQIIVTGPEEALTIVNDWAFTEGYAFITESYRARIARFACYYYRLKTRNSRKLEEKDRKRVSTYERYDNYKTYMYISILKSIGNQWVLQYRKNVLYSHNHAIDLFLL
jgi:hypothetical protein